MSIYCTRTTLGKGWPGDGAGLVVAHPGNDLRRVTRRGWPRDATIDTAHVPHWCIPGHDEGDACRYQDDDAPVSEWLRISINTTGAYMTVLADREAIAALRDDLTAWLDMRHATARTAKR